MSLKITNLALFCILIAIVNSGMHILRCIDIVAYETYYLDTVYSNFFDYVNLINCLALILYFPLYKHVYSKNEGHCISH